jgi:hypothetical protein
MPVIPDTQEGEAGEQFDCMSLGNIARPCLKKQTEKTKKKKNNKKNPKTPVCIEPAQADSC